MLTSNGAGSKPSFQAAGGITCPTNFTASGADCKWTQTANGSVAVLEWTGLSGDNYTLKCPGFFTASLTAAGIQTGEGGTPTWNTGAHYDYSNVETITGGSTVTGVNVQNATSVTAEAAGNVSATAEAALIAEFVGLSMTRNHKPIFQRWTVSAGSLVNVYTGAGAWNNDTNAVTAIRLSGNSINFANGTKCTLYYYAS